jgi:hypothetical protein
MATGPGYGQGGLARRGLLAGALGAAVGTAIAGPASGAQAGQTADPAWPDVADDWFELVVELAAPPPGVPPAAVNERIPAISWMSALAALNAAAARPLPAPQRPRFEDAAVATAVHDALAALLPNQTSRLEAALTGSLAAIPDGDGKQAGIRAGRDAAVRTLRAHGPEAPGVYRFPPGGTDPGGFGQGRALPILLGRADRFRPGPPPALGSEVYRRDLSELHRLGGLVSARTERQSDIAWLAPQRLYTPALRALLRVPGCALPWKVRLLAAYTTATVDAGLAVAEAKATYLHWRPVTAIRAADTDGDPRTRPDPDWSSYLPTPANPDWPSGHGGFAGAAEQVLEHFTGPRTPVTFTAVYQRGDGKAVALDYPRGTPWSVLTQDNVDARVWAGVHFRFSDEVGAALGRRVAAYNLRRLESTA